ncbi:MAG: hypothetical protein ACJZ7A_01685 [Opitutales bacterium]
MKKYPIFFTFCYFTLFPFGHATDWAPASLEGILTRVTIDVPEHQMDIMGMSIPIQSISQTNYSYIHNGTMHWGYNESQMLESMFFDYQKTSGKSFNLQIWFPHSKTLYSKASISMTDQKNGSGTVVQVINLPGHPLYGTEIFNGTLTYEVLSSVPLLPPDIATGIYSIQTDVSNDWVEEDGILISGEEDSDPNHHFKYLLPTDMDWSFQWVDKANLVSGESLTSLYLHSPKAHADVDFYFMQDQAGFEFDWAPVPLFSSGYDLIDPLTVSSASYNPSLNSGIRVHYESSGRKLKAEFDESLSGNWVLFFEGSLDAGVDSWVYHDPTGHSQTGFVNTQFEALPQHTMEVESVVNQDISATDSFQLYGPRPVSLTFAVGNDTLDDISSASQADFATAGSDIGGGWRLLDWFRYYYATTAGWLYHIDHEWIYPVVTSFDSVWFYSPTHDWLWTTQTAYPWTWFHTGQSWKYYISSTNKWVSN